MLIAIHMDEQGFFLSCGPKGK